MNAETMAWAKFAITIVVFLSGLAGLWSKFSVRLALIERDVKEIKEKVGDTVTTGDCDLRQERCPARREYVTDVRRVAP